MCQNCSYNAVKHSILSPFYYYFVIVFYNQKPALFYSTTPFPFSSGFYVYKLSLVPGFLYFLSHQWSLHHRTIAGQMPEGKLKKKYPCHLNRIELLKMKTMLYLRIQGTGPVFTKYFNYFLINFAAI